MAVTCVAQTLYDAIFISIYNLIFTSLPILAVGIFEQDVSDATSLKIPSLYEAGPQHRYFSLRSFVASLLRGVFHSLVLFFTFHVAVKAGGQVCH